MRLVSGIAIYFVIWWTVLFVTLPWGAKSPHESGDEVGQGHAPSAPIRPMMWRKVLATTILSAFVFAAVLWARNSGVLSLDSWTFGMQPPAAQ